MDDTKNTKPVFEIYALRYATSQNRKRYHNCNFCENPDIHESKMPMDFFLSNEKDIRQVMKQERLRTYYRGKRNNRYDTYKADATGVVFYSNIYG